mmetsp:Transcript_93588/g.165593  ORF Transcript_93588/g.165593 Transcript_93588/m.165593 type:complete len:410 (+) Transcript_93588:66-1295(+)
MSDGSRHDDSSQRNGDISDPFEALGMGPDVYDYRRPYWRYLEEVGKMFAGACQPACDRQYRRAAEVITNADFLLIGAGAGMGVDSGLATYADVASVAAWAERGHDYGSLCRPSLLREDPSLFYGFWGHCYNQYMDAHPHQGYNILRRWCTEVIAPPIEHGLLNHWVYTSNVDGHFLRAGFDPKAVLELHGGVTGAKGWFCPTCSDSKLQDTVNVSDLFSGSSEAEHRGFRFPVDALTMQVADGDAGHWPRCARPGCRGLLRPAAHLFGEDNAALLAHFALEEERYVAWEVEMEKCVRGLKSGSNGRKAPRLVLLEIGCGLRVPSVRMEMECVLRDLVNAERHHLEEAETCQVVLVRINPDWPQNPLMSEHTIEIRAQALEALTAIDRCINKLRSTHSPSSDPHHTCSDL